MSNTSDGEKSNPALNPLVFAAFLSMVAAHAFSYQDIGRRRWGEIVTGGAAWLVGVIMLVMAICFAVDCFVKSKKMGFHSSMAVGLYTVIVIICMFLQWVMYCLGVDQFIAGIIIFLLTALTWPLIALLQWIPRELKK